MSSLRAFIERFARSMERYSGTDNVYLLKNVSYLWVNQGLSVLTGFGLYWIYAHLVSKELFGEYKYLITFFGLFSIAALTGVEPALSRAVARGYEGSVKQAFLFKLRYGFIGAGIALLLAGYYLFHRQTTIGYSMIALAVFGPWAYASNVYASYFTGKKQFRTYSIINSLISVGTCIAIITATILCTSATSLFVVFLATNTFSLIPCLYVLKRITDTRIDPELRSFSFHLSLLDILAIISSRLDSVLTFHNLGSIPLALYSFAVVPADQVKGLLKSITSIAQPKFATAQLATLQKTLLKKMGAYMALIALACFGYIVVAPIAFHVFFPAYSTSILYSQVYVLSFIPAIPAGLLYAVFESKGLKKETAVFNVSGQTVQIALLCVLSYLYGIWGTIAAQVIARCVMLIVAWILFVRAHEGAHEAQQVVEIP